MWSCVDHGLQGGPTLQRSHESLKRGDQNLQWEIGMGRPAMRGAEVHNWTSLSTGRSPRSMDIRPISTEKPMKAWPLQYLLVNQ